MNVPRSDRGISQSSKGELCQAGTKREKTKLPDEYCRDTGESGKYFMVKTHWALVKPGRSNKRKEMHDAQVRAALANIREVFDCPCGQRLKSIPETDALRVRRLDEIELSNELAAKSWLPASETAALQATFADC
jgi:hypothetical protein